MAEIRIKLNKILTSERFKRIQNDIWEWFGDISKEAITLDKTAEKELKEVKRLIRLAESGNQENAFEILSHLKFDLIRFYEEILKNG